MRRFIKNLTVLYLEAVSAIKKLAAQEDSDLAVRAFAEATWLQRRDDYINQRGLKPTSGHVCVSRLINRRCTGKTSCHIPGADHVSLWLKDGRPEVYISQPYGLTLDTMRELVQLCDTYGLDVGVRTWPSWHFPGETLTIEVRRKSDKDK